MAHHRPSLFFIQRQYSAAVADPHPPVMALHIVAVPGAPAGVTNGAAGRAPRFGPAIDATVIRRAITLAARLIGRGRPAHPRARVLCNGGGRDAKHRRCQTGGNQERFHVESFRPGIGPHRGDGRRAWKVPLPQQVRHHDGNQLSSPPRWTDQRCISRSSPYPLIPADAQPDRIGIVGAGALGLGRLPR